MFSQQIADKIRAKVSALVSQELRVLDANGQTLSATPALTLETINLTETPWTIPFSYGGNVVGYVVLQSEMPNHQEIAPLIRSIAELVMHQSIVLEQIPRQDERLDKFIYDLLNQPQPDWSLLAAEARLFDIELERPRIAIVIQIDDPTLVSRFQDPSNDRGVEVQEQPAEGVGRRERRTRGASVGDADLLCLEREAGLGARWGARCCRPGSRDPPDVPARRRPSRRTG